MSYLYYKSYLGDGVIDIKGAVPPTVPSPGTILDAWTQKKGSPCDENQLWQFEADPLDPAWFYITSKLGGLVIDIQGGCPAASGTPLDAYTKKTSSPANNNQLWQFVPAGPKYPNYGFILSGCDSSLVIDVTGGKLSPGVGLQVNKQKTTNYESQLWTPISQED